MFARPLDQNPERGAITVFFVLFVLIASAAVTYALYIGRSVEEKVRTDTAADLSALAMAQHAAMGLNMVSTNNLAIAGNLHIGAAIPHIGRYYSLLIALDVDPGTTFTDKKFTEHYRELMQGVESADKSLYADGFEKSKTLTGRFIKTAAGLTEINLLIAKHWVKGGLVKGVEQLRLNKPGDVGLMFQASTAQSASSAATFYNMKFNNLALATPKETMCHTIQSSEGIDGDRNYASFWIRGLIESFGKSVVSDVAIGAVDLVEKSIRAVGGEVSSQVDDTIGEMKNEVKAITGGLACSDDFDKLSRKIARKARKLCKKIDELGGLDRPDGMLPVFDQCGINSDGDFGTQFEKFTNVKSQEKHAIGFVFPNVNGQSVKTYEDSLQFAAAVGNPLYLASEMPNADRYTSNGAKLKVTTCPAAWQVEVNGNQYCSLMVDGVDFGFQSDSQEQTGRDLAGGGVGRAVGANGGGNDKGALNGIWSRVQWSIGQAKAEYEPGDGDPGYAGLSGKAQYENADQRASKRRLQFFWPAWKARNSETTVLDGVLGMLGKF